MPVEVVAGIEAIAAGRVSQEAVPTHVAGPEQTYENMSLEEPASVDPLLSFDSEKFKEVSQHGGSINEAIQQFKDDPEKPLPPCLKRLGITTVGQLVERVEGNATTTKREPTIGELRAARKKEAEKLAASADTAKPEKNTEPAVKVESEIPTFRIESILAVEPNTTEKVVLAPIQAKLVEESQQIVMEAHVQPISQTEDVIVQKSIEAEQVRATQGAVLANLEQPTTVVREVVPESIAIEAADSVPVSVAASVEDLASPPQHDIALQYLDELSFETEDQPITSEEVNIEINELEIPVVELVSDISMSEVSEMEIESLAEFVLSDALPVATDIDTTMIVEASADVAISIETLGQEIAPKEIVTPIELQEELSVYIELLEPSEVTVALATLEELTEIIQSTQEHIETVHGVLPPVERIEQLLRQLLESLGEEAVETIMHAWLTPELLTQLVESDKLLIDQFNYIGTHEYKSNSIISMSTKLLKLIKKTVGPHVHIGKYVLSASLANGI